MAGDPPAQPAPVEKPAPFSRQQVTNLLTLIVVVVWIVTAVVRIWVDWPEAAILDAAMPIVIGYYFLSTAVRRNGNGAHA